MSCWPIGPIADGKHKASRAFHFRLYDCYDTISTPPSLSPPVRLLPSLFSHRPQEYFIDDTASWLAFPPSHSFFDAMILQRYSRSVDGTIPVAALLYDDEESYASQDGVGIYDG